MRSLERFIPTDLKLPEIINELILTLFILIIGISVATTLVIPSVFAIYSSASSTLLVNKTN